MATGVANKDPGVVSVQLCRGTPKRGKYRTPPQFLSVGRSVPPDLDTAPGRAPYYDESVREVRFVGSGPLHVADLDLLTRRLAGNVMAQYHGDMLQLLSDVT